MIVRLYVEIIHELKHVDYLHVQADKPWHNYYVNNNKVPGQCVQIRAFSFMPTRQGLK